LRPYGAAIAAAALVAVVASACAPPATAPAPQMQAVAPCPTSNPAGVGSDAAPSGDPVDSQGAGAQVVVVAEDEDGRPEIVSTTVHDAASVVDELEADGTLDVVAIEPPEQVSLATTGVAATDPRRSEQWALNDLTIESAWTRSRGAQVDIAVIDTGVAATHPDLRGKVCGGVAYLGGDGVARTGKGATDPHGHGTHVAGIAAASSDDGVGIAGVAPDARIMAIRVMDAQGHGYTSDVARGITWAVDHGAEVVNLSLGGPATPSMRLAVDYALNNGVVVVAAAGNDHQTGDDPSYPGAYEGAIAVASYDSNGTVSSFSTRGDYVDVAAPGSSILSTLNTGDWVRMSGTSMATPHVAGIAALLIAQQPSRTPAQVRERLESTALDAGPIGPDPAYGAGRVRPVAALGG
ncbi:MAG: S8 family peptidase, partial [Microthrixaceae bacterium]